MTDTTPTTLDPPQLWKPPPGRQLRGATGERFKDAVVQAYLVDIKSIRQIAEETGRVYSSIRRILHRRGVKFRKRGVRYPRKGPQQ